jgi:hypothetical protein
LSVFFNKKTLFDVGKSKKKKEEEEEEEEEAEEEEGKRSVTILFSVCNHLINVH